MLLSIYICNYLALCAGEVAPGCLKQGRLKVRAVSMPDLGGFDIRFKVEAERLRYTEKVN